MFRELPGDSPIIKETFEDYERITIPFDCIGSKLLRMIITQLLFLLGCIFLFEASLIHILEYGSDFFYNAGFILSTGLGLFFGYGLFRLIRKSVPERYILNNPNLIFENGIPPLHIHDKNHGNYNSTIKI